MATNQVPLYLDPSVGVRRYTGTDTIYHNLTDSSGNVMDLQKSGSTVMAISNDGLLTLGTATNPVGTIPSLDVRGRPNLDDPLQNQILRLYDADVGESVFAVTKTELSAGTGAWAVNMVLRNSDTPQLLDEALRITHDLRENSPTYPTAKLLSAGYTNATGVYQEQAKFDHAGDFYIRNDIKWLASGGVIGSSNYAATTTPSSIYAVTSVNAAGTSILENEIKLGQAPLVDGDRQITAVLTGTDAYLRWDNSVGYWTMFDGTTEYPIGTSTVTDWDALLASSQTMDLDGDAPLTWTQTDTLGYGFILKKDVTTAANALMKIETVAGFNTAVPLLEVHRSGFGTGLGLSVRGNIELISQGSTALTNEMESLSPFELKTEGSTLPIGILTTGSASGITLKASGTGASFVAIQSTNSYLNATCAQGMTLSSGLTSSWTVSSGNLNLNCAANGTMSLDMFNGIFDSTNALTIKSGTGAGGYGFDINNQGSQTSYVRTTNAGILQVYADTGSTSAHLIVASGGNTTISSGLALDLHVDTTGDTYDLSLTVPDSTNQEILFRAHGSAQIPFNADGADSDLVGFTATSVIGALNETNALLGAGTLDAAYNADAGSASIAVDAGSVTWNLSGAYITQFTKALSASPGGAAYSVKNAISSSANLINGDSLVAYYGRAVGNGAGDHDNSEVIAFQAIGDAVTEGISYGFHADANCAYGLYSLSKALISDAPAAAPAAALAVTKSAFISPRLLTSADGIALFQASPTGHINDAVDSTYTGFYAQGTATGGAQKYGVVIDGEWDVGLLSFAKSAIGATLPVTGGNLLELNASSGGLTGTNVLSGAKVAISPDGSDSGTSSIYGFFAEGDATGSAVKTAFRADATGWRYGLWSEAPIRTDIVGTGPTALDINVASSGITSGLLQRISSVSFAQDATDTANINALDLSINVDASATGTIKALNINAGWTYGLYSLSKALVSVSGVTTTTVGADLSITSNSLGVSQSAAVCKVTYTDGGTDHVGSLPRGLHVVGDATSPATSKQGVLIDAGWDYGMYVVSGLTYGIRSFSPTYVSTSGHTTGTNSSSTAEVASGGMTAALAGIRGIRVNVSGHANDTAGSAYGVWVPNFTDNGGSLSTDSVLGVRVGGNWQYGIKSESRIWSDFTAATSALSPYISKQAAIVVDAAPPTGGFTSAGSATGQLVYITDHASDIASARYYGNYVYTTNNATLSIKAGYYSHPSLDYSLQAVDSNVQIDMDYYDGMYSNSIGAVNVETTVGTALSDTTRYGVRVDHSGNAGDTGGVNIHNFHSSGDTVGGSIKTGYYAGAGSGNGLIYGFHSERVARGVYCEEGNVTATTISSSYAPTSTENALFSSNLNSSTFSSGSWYNNAARYTYHASDVGGTWYGYYADTSGTLVAGVQTIGFQAASNVDVGIRSYAPQNRFQRADDISTTTQPVVLIQNNDNDSTGGTAPALKVTNTYDNIASTCIEIDSAYDLSTEGTRRAIVFTNARKNRRQHQLDSFQPESTSSTTQWYKINTNSGGSAVQAYWRIVSTTAGNVINIPLRLPQGSTITFMRVSLSMSGTGPATESQRCRLRLYRKGSSSFTSEAYLGQSYATSPTGTQNVDISGLSHVVNNLSYTYFLELRGPIAAGRTLVYLLGGFYDYELTDFSAGVGY